MEEQIIAMRLAAMVPVRNEDWILGLHLRVLLLFCDRVVVLLHECSDESANIVWDCWKESGGRVSYTSIGGGWDEMKHRRILLDIARAEQATHLWIGDADEILTGNLIPNASIDVRHLISETPPGHILQLPLYNLRGGINRYHSNGLWGQRWVSVAFADDPRLHWSGDRFHHREPMGVELKPWQPVAHGAGGMMHLWAANEARCREKHRAYKIHEALRWPDKDRRVIEREYNQWRSAGESIYPHFAQSPWLFERVPKSWWEPYRQWMQHLHLDREPWQRAWCDRMIAEHGRERFAGLSV